MAIDQENGNLGRAPGSGSASEFGTPGAAPGGRTDVEGRRLYDILCLTNSLDVSPQHKRYLEEITDSAKKVLPNLELLALQSPSGAQAFVVRDRGDVHYAFIVLFSSQIPQNPNFLPVSDRIKDAVDSLGRRLQGKTVRVVSAQIISDRDLNRSAQMISMLSTVMLTAISPDIRETNARTLSAGLEWVVDPNLSSAMDLINRLSPVETLPYAEYGFTLCARQPQNRQFGYGNQLPAPTDPIIACVGYTEVVGPIQDPSSGIQKFLPIIHITTTASRVPTMAAELMALVQMVQFAVVNQGWKLPFKRFQPGHPNLGNLRTNPQDMNKLWFIENADVMEQFIRDQFFQPIVVMDVQEGAFRIPARHYFAGNTANEINRIGQETSRFFEQNLPAMTGPLPLCTTIAQEFSGTYGDAVQYDSRKITYLNQAAQGAMDKRTADVLLSYQNDPIERAKVVSDLTNSFTSLYRNRLSLISPEYLIHLSGMIQRSGLRIIDQTTQSGTVPLAGFIGAGSNFTGFQNFAYQRTSSVMDASGAYGI